MTAGHGWIRIVPEHWTRGRIKNLLASSTNGTWGDDPTDDSHNVKCIRAADFDRQRRRVNLDTSPSRAVAPIQLAQHKLGMNDLIIEKSGGGEKQPVGMVVLFDHQDLAVCSNFCAKIVPAENVEPRFLNYVFHAAYSQGLTESAIKQTTGIQNLDTGALFSAPWAYPAMDEQRRIVGFLDAETSRIDEITGLRSKSISLQEERLTSLIDRIVRGEGRSETKAAEYPPLGKVPTSWKVGRLRSVDCEVQTGPFGSQLHADDYVDNAWPVINPANITTNGLVADPQITVSTDVRDRLSRHTLRSGDIIFGRRGELGRAAVVSAEQVGWLCGTGCLRLRFRHNEVFHSGYLHRYLGLTAVRHYFHLHALGSTMPNLNTSTLLNMPLLIPPLDEQGTISQQCDAEEQSTLERIGLLQRQLALLTERRRALITAAVTGQFDVSTASGRGVME